MIVRVEAIFYEEWGGDYYLVAGVEERLEYDVDRPAGPAGHDYFVG